MESLQVAVSLLRGFVCSVLVCSWCLVPVLLAASTASRYRVTENRRFFTLLGKSWSQRAHSFGKAKKPRHRDFSLRAFFSSITTCSTCGAPPVLNNTRAKRQTATQAHAPRSRRNRQPASALQQSGDFGDVQNPGTKEDKKQARRQSINEKKRRMAWLLKIKNVNDLGGACPSHGNF